MSRDLPPPDERPRSARSQATLHATDVFLWLTALCIVGFAVFEVSALVLRISQPRPRTALAAEPRAPVRGEVLSSQWLGDVSQSDHTMLFVLSSQCAYCTNGMPFYRDLLSRRPPRSTVRFVAGCIEPLKTCTDYLRTHRLTTDEVVSLPVARDGLFVRTPMLILLDKKGRVMSVWIGQQSVATERAIEVTLLKL
jgi:hypothetical protein